MLQLRIESASYSELDFPLFNGAGFKAIQQAVELAQQARALAQTPEELQKAAWMMRAAADRKNQEQEIAMRSFNEARQTAFETLKKLAGAFDKSALWGQKRLEVENQIDHLVTKFSLKNFTEVAREAGRLLPRLNAPTPVRPAPPPPAWLPRPARMSSAQPISSKPQSASAWFERGCAMERKGRRSEAIEAYRQALQMNPRHFQAENHLNRLSAMAGRRAS
jgi:tetratricopeptide (TPR) repeat protein